MEKLVTANKFQDWYKGKKVFVTGHTGFKGSWLCAWLQQLGAVVKGYALEPQYEHGLFNLLPPLSESIIADIREKERLQAEMVAFQPDYIFHLAAQPLVRRSYHVPAETFEVNATGTANLLEAVRAIEKKCTIIIITTDKVYHNKNHDILYNEEDELGGADPYSASKACAEIIVSSFRNSFFCLERISEHKKAIASVRAGNVIGGGDYSTDRIIPDIISALEKNIPVELRNPDAVRPWQHVLEPLSGYLLLGGLLNDQPEKFSGAYNFGPDEWGHLKVKELVDLCIKIWGNGGWKDISNPSQPYEASLLKLDISKAKKVLDWHPKLTAAMALEWTIAWYKQDRKNHMAFSVEQINDYMNL